MDELHFELFLLFLAVSSQDHEDSMCEILDVLVEGEEGDVTDALIAAEYSAVYHRPTSLEEEVLEELRAIVQEGLN
jgi:hypothetical protein